MRSPREISTRLRQEAVNLIRFLSPPRPPLDAPLRPAAVFPDPALAASRVRESRFAAQLISIAEQVCAHRFPVFGTVIQTGPEIDWHRDYHNGKTSGNGFFRRIPYLDFETVGDHKWIWELNRHQHLIVLAQAYLLTERREFLLETENQLASWHAQNPFLCGINWASALEVAFRALSWVRVDSLIGDRLNPEARRSLQNGLWLHAKHLESNLSLYFSPNTHLLGEAVALYAIGKLYPDMPGASRFAHIGGVTTERQLEFQVHADGSHFEQSTYYHVYAVDFFVLYYLLAGKPPGMRDRLRQMAEYLDTIAGPARRLFASGDDDGGRLFYPYGRRDCFARATLATCATLFPDAAIGFESEDLLEQAAWWVDAALLDPPQPTRRDRSQRFVAFPDSGMVSIEHGELHVLFDAGPFGWGGAGHSHADTLNILVRSGAEPILTDSGTFTYVADLKARDWFRGTGAHNTIRIDGRDQADPVKPFRWQNKPAVKLNRSNGGYADAQCEYRGFTHRRRILVCGDSAVIVLDDINGPAGDHTVEQFWNLNISHFLLLPGEHRTVEAWRSDVYGSRVPSRQVVATRTGALPLRLAAALLLAEQTNPNPVILEEASGATVIVAGNIRAVFPPTGDAEWAFTK